MYSRHIGDTDPFFPLFLLGFEAEIRGECFALFRRSLDEGSAVFCGGMFVHICELCAKYRNAVFF